MGVPVIALAGQTHAGRVGVSLLTRAGLSELIAEDPEAYVQLAIYLAEDSKRLRALRAGLRERILQSPLVDARGITHDIETQFREMWRQWVIDETSFRSRVGPHDPIGHSQLLEPLTIRIGGHIELCVPGSIQLLTPYVLLEQEDWFEDEIAFVRHLLKPGMRAVDIGASYGVFSLTMAKAVGPAGQVWSFEPASGPMVFLTESLRQNRLHNLELIQAALSSRSGLASLKVTTNSELSTLVEATTIRSEHQRVRLVTLDDCAREYGWEDLDFIKMDAEGEETRILEGARQLLDTHSPLVLFEFRRGTAHNFALLSQFLHIGYQLYRLVPGLGLLAPYDPDATADPFQLNLFACRTDRAKLLEQNGLLAFDSSENPSPATSPRFNEFSYERPYARALCKNWAANTETVGGRPYGREYQQALSSYAIAHNSEWPAAVRYAHLRGSYEKLLEIAKRAATVSRLQSLARVAWEIGKRQIAVSTLGSLLQRVKDDPVPPSEPFLAVSPRFDLIPPGNELIDWALASALEQREKLRDYSSYFTRASTLPDLDQMKALPFYGPAMERRRQLIRMRHHMQGGPEPHPLLAIRTAEHLNLEFWRPADSHA